MKHLIILTLFIFVRTISYSQIDSLDQYSNAMEIFIKDSNCNEVFYNRRYIPKVLTKSIKEYFNSDFRLANPNSFFYKTDVIKNSLLPRKKMLFLIKNQNKYALVYRRGGRALQTYFIFAEIEESIIVQFNVFNINNNIITIDEFLDQVVCQQKYRINKEK